MPDTRPDSALITAAPSDSPWVEGLLFAHQRAGGALEGVPVLARLLSELEQVCRDGQVCLPLNEAAESSALTHEHSVLMQSPLVGNGSKLGPLVVDRSRLYRRRDWLAETALAKGLSDLAVLVEHAALDRTGGHASPALDTLNQKQLRALAHVLPGVLPAQAPGTTRTKAMSSRLLVLSGGPGTGKTHTLAAIIRLYHACHPTRRIAVAAPTGKAATRLAEGLTGQIESAQLSVATVHRLLGYRGDGRFSRDRLTPIDADLVIVDECSMLDSRTAAQLVTALPAEALLVLAGDRDQLASVQAGAFFGALCQSRAPALVSSRVMLDENYRQREAPALIGLAQALAVGQDPTEAMTRVQNDALVIHGPTHGATDEHGHWHHDLVTKAVELAVQCYRPWVTAARHARTPDEAIDALRAFHGARLLSALRAGPAGIVALNRAIVAHLFPGSQVVDSGRLIVIRRNMPALDLFNGDVGITMRSAGRMAVVFESGASVPLDGLGLWDDAFALTVHQAQGSEFERVLLIPAPAGHPLATREALYTGVTRARARLDIFADPESMRAAAGTSGREQLSLLERLNAGA